MMFHWRADDGRTLNAGLVALLGGGGAIVLFHVQSKDPDHQVCSESLLRTQIVGFVINY